MALKKTGLVVTHRAMILIVLRARGIASGLDIAEQAEALARSIDRDLGRIKSGLYSALRRLEGAGLVEEAGQAHRAGAKGGYPATYFRLTAAGRKEAEAAFRYLQHVIDLDDNGRP